ncbi:MAG: hypothetical protein ACOC5R_00550 [Elusimicrobiota bacterium]
MKLFSFTRKKNKGISYLEIAIAIAILGYILAAFAQVFLKNNVSLVQSKMHTLAYNWAADSVEQIKRKYYTDITTSAFTTESRVLGEDKTFTKQVGISEITEGLKEIEVKISWTNPKQSREIRVVTYIADY